MKRGILASFSLTWMLSVVAFIPTANAATIGGWSASRGGVSGIARGGDFALIRRDLEVRFPGNSIVETDELTREFLSGVDVLLLDPVYGLSNVPIAPLNVSEQTALTDWVYRGGRALIIAENTGYFEASRSLTEPFGLEWADAVQDGQQFGTIVDTKSFAKLSNGRFGVVTRFGGWYVSSFANGAPATVLGTWNTGGAAIAAMNYGAGNVVFFGDDALIANYGATNNDVLRRNTLDFLISVPEPSSATFLATAILSFVSIGRRVEQFRGASRIVTH